MKLSWANLLTSETGSVRLSQDQVSQGAWHPSKEQRSETAFRHPFTKTDGKSPEILDIPPHPLSSNAGNLVHYLQQTQWNHFLNETPQQSCVLSQRPLSSLSSNTSFLPFPSLPSIWYEVQQFNQQHVISKVPTVHCLRLNPGKHLAGPLSLLTNLSNRMKPVEQDGLLCSA